MNKIEKEILNFAEELKQHKNFSIYIHRFNLLLWTFIVLPIWLRICIKGGGFWWISIVVLLFLYLFVLLYNIDILYSFYKWFTSGCLDLWDISWNWFNK